MCGQVGVHLPHEHEGISKRGLKDSCLIASLLFGNSFLNLKKRIERGGTVPGGEPFSVGTTGISKRGLKASIPLSDILIAIGIGISKRGLKEQLGITGAGVRSDGESQKED